MFRALRDVRDQILERWPGSGPISLEQISQVVESLTYIDELFFVSYDVPVSNPILGQFHRYTRRPSVYGSMLNVVEVRYAKHLPEDWRRLVVCKEICHALDVTDINASVTDAAIVHLVECMALRSASALPAVGTLGAPMQTELIAEAAAVELLCPIPVRRAFLAEGKYVADAQVASEFGIPEGFVKLSFSEQYMEMVEYLMNRPE